MKNDNPAALLLQGVSTASEIARQNTGLVC